MSKVTLLLITFLCSSISAFANPTIGMPTGSAGGTYFPMGADIATLASRIGLDIEVKKSAGSLDNIRRMAGRENAGISIVQSDVIDFLSSNPSKVNDSVLQDLRLVFPLYKEEIHLLARDDIKSIQDLKKKRVVVGKLGSGTHITANNILNILDIDVVKVHDLPPKEAFQALVMGEVDAVFFVGGKPIRYIAGLLEMRADERLRQYTDTIHIVPLNDNRLYTSYAKASFTPADYVSSDGNHRLTDIDVPTIAVQAILVSHDFARKQSSYYKMRCKQINQIDTVVRENLERLKSGRQYHPKWEQVDLDQSIQLAKSSCINTGGVKIDHAKQISCYLESGSNCNQQDL